jgi:hypothetical protein
MNRRFLSAVAVSVATLTLAPAPAAQAANTCGQTNYCQTNYYTNPSHTTLVGQVTYFCGGAESQWGVVTGFKVTTSSPCGL